MADICAKPDAESVKLTTAGKAAEDASTDASSEAPEARFTGMHKKEPEEERSIMDLFTPENIQDTIEHCQKRDWSNTKWDVVALITAYHVLAIPGLYYFLFDSSWLTTLFWVVTVYTAGLSFCGGIHRLWGHNSYKCHPAIELFYAMGCTIAAPNAFQNSIFDWTSEHRVHHKYSETNADPHNAMRGFFFTHIGWLCMPLHPDVAKYSAENDLSDLTNNKIIMFQHNNRIPLTILFTFFLPTMIPVFYWGEGLIASFLICCWRVTIFHHFTWFVNSLAHWQGAHPYDNTIYPAENMFTSVVAFGEGWHNFHHRFPIDYRTSDRDFGMAKPLFNATSTFIDFWADMGFVTDRITVSQKLIKKSIEEHGE